MAHINIHKLTHNATGVGLRAIDAHQSPEVRQARAKAFRDVTNAAQSVAEYVAAFRAEWLLLASGDVPVGYHLRA